MIRVSAHISKKVPLPNVAFSSQQFGAELEIEVSDADSADAVKQRLRDLYSLLSYTIDEQIATVAHPAALPSQSSAPRRHTHTTRVTGAAASHQGQRAPAVNGTQTQRVVTATQAQQRALFAICKSQGLDIAAVLADYNGDPAQLTVKAASLLIDELKSRQNGNGNHAQ
jgi:hypothetical protein